MILMLKIVKDRELIIFHFRSIFLLSNTLKTQPNKFLNTIFPCLLDPQKWIPFPFNENVKYATAARISDLARGRIPNEVIHFLLLLGTL